MGGILLIIFVSLFITSTSSTKKCSNLTFTSKRVFTSCKDLPYLKAHLHWTYFESSKQVTVAFRARHKGWIAWAINPFRLGMVGSQALVACLDAKRKMLAYTTSVDGYNPLMQPSKIMFPVSNLSAEYVNKEMIIFAVVGLENGSVVNHVWQIGELDNNGVPQMHEMEFGNLHSTGVVDFSSSL